MFKHILIPTDGSDLSRKAVLYGVQLAKETGAKVTSITVTDPYRAPAMDAVMIPVDQGEYEEAARGLSERAMEQVKMAGEAAGVPVETVSENSRPAVSRHHRRRACARLRPHRHGLARAARDLGAVARQRNGQGADALDHPGAGLPLGIVEQARSDARRPGLRYLASGAAARRLSFARSARPCLTRTSCWSASTPIRMTVPMTAKLRELGMPSRLTRFCRT